MHEASLIESMLNIAKSELAPYRVKRINSLTLSVGIFSGAMEAALYAAFDAAKEGIFSDARLIIEQKAAKVICLRCGSREELYAFPYQCAVCGNNTMELLSGQELNMQSIDFDEEDE